MERVLDPDHGQRRRRFVAVAHDARAGDDDLFHVGGLGSLRRRGLRARSATKREHQRGNADAGQGVMSHE